MKQCLLNEPVLAIHQDTSTPPGVKLHNASCSATWGAPAQPGHSHSEDSSKNSKNSPTSQVGLHVNNSQPGLKELHDDSYLSCEIWARKIKYMKNDEGEGESEGSESWVVALVNLGSKRINATIEYSVLGWHDADFNNYHIDILDLWKNTNLNHQDNFENSVANTGPGSVPSASDRLKRSEPYSGPAGDTGANSVVHVFTAEVGEHDTGLFRFTRTRRPRASQLL